MIQVLSVFFPDGRAERRFIIGAAKAEIERKEEIMKTVDEINLSGKRVFVRVDFNVPLDKQAAITDDGRILAALPTLQAILEKGAKLIVASHLGRPKGEKNSAFSLAPVAARLEELLGKKVIMAPDCVGPEVEAIVSDMLPGDVVLLENLRFHPQEEENDPDFGKSLAALCDVYINDAFAVCHRKHASVHAIAGAVPEKGAGMLLQKELAYFQKAMENPKRPLVAIIGGAKVSSKLTALQNMMGVVDKIVIGGAMANTFLAYQGYDLGASLVEKERLEDAAEIMRVARERKIAFFLPVDLVVAETMREEAVSKTVPIQEVPANWMALDIGPATSIVYRQALENAATIVWNGPMGVFEMPAFSRGTMALARSIADGNGLSIIGGGDTGAAVHLAGEEKRMSYISTGGGAFLALLEGKSLPAVSVLQ